MKLKIYVGKFSKLIGLRNLKMVFSLKDLLPMGAYSFILE